MLPEILMLLDPPRSVMAAGNGSMMIELEDRIALIRKDSSLLQTVCFPEEKGETLLWPAGPKRCVMLGPKGVLKVYEDRKLVETRPGLMLEDDEPVRTIETGNGSVAVLVGRMTGNELVLSTPEYRFLWIGPKLDRLDRSGYVMKRRPLAWGTAQAKSVLILAVQPEGEKLISLGLESGNAQDVAWPPELKDRHVTGLSVEPMTGNIALTVSGGKGQELGVIPAIDRKYMLLAVGAGTADRLDRPSWSPDGRHVLYRMVVNERISLMAASPVASSAHQVCLMGEADEALWLDANVVAVVKWDGVLRINLGR